MPEGPPPGLSAPAGSSGDYLGPPVSPKVEIKNEEATEGPEAGTIGMAETVPLGSEGVPASEEAEGAEDSTMAPEGATDNAETEVLVNPQELDMGPDSAMAPASGPSDEPDGSPGVPFSMSMETPAPNASPPEGREEVESGAAEAAAGDAQNDATGDVSPSLPDFDDEEAENGEAFLSCPNSPRAAEVSAVPAEEDVAMSPEEQALEERVRETAERVPALEERVRAATRAKGGKGRQAAPASEARSRAAAAGPVAGVSTAIEGEDLD